MLNSLNQFLWSFLIRTCKNWQNFDFEPNPLIFWRFLTWKSPKIANENVKDAVRAKCNEFKRQDYLFNLNFTLEIHFLSAIKNKINFTHLNRVPLKTEYGLSSTLYIYQQGNGSFSFKNICIFPTNSRVRKLEITTFVEFWAPKMQFFGLFWAKKCQKWP